jgi:protein gp37
MQKVAVQEVPLDALRTDGGTQPRGEIDLFAVADYAADMGAGVEFPPAHAVHDGTDYWLWDGLHRYHAARKAGRESLRVSVTAGTVEDARWLALGANKTHGLRRKNEDKRRAVEAALAHPKAKGLSDPQIAQHCGVSHNMVWEHRQRLSSDESDPVRTGKDGRSINTANIGRRAAAQPDPDPVASLAESIDTEAVTAGGAEHYLRERPPLEQLPPRAELPLAADTPSGPPPYVPLERWKAMPAPERRALLAEAPEGRGSFNRQTTDSIEWAKWSWNPVTGCRHNCPYCYARDIAERFYEQKFEPSLWPDRLRTPRRMRPPAEAAQDIGLRNVFTCSMADLFGRWVPKEWIEAVLAEVRTAADWNFLFLTKFPNRLAEFEFPDNAWVGTTVDCQARVENAEKSFRKVKAGRKWLSCEPLIEPLRFTDLGAFDWVVVGGASASSQTPAWLPPRKWVDALEREADRVGCFVYEKTNVGPERRREHPGAPAEPERLAPEALRYLPTDNVRTEAKA